MVATPICRLGESSPQHQDSVASNCREAPEAALFAPCLLASIQLDLTVIGLIRRQDGVLVASGPWLDGVPFF